MRGRGRDLVLRREVLTPQLTEQDVTAFLRHLVIGDIQLR